MSVHRMVLAGLAATLVACQKKAAAPAAANEVTITATDYSFAAPDTIPAGLTTFRMLNQGKEPHQAVVMGAADHSFEEIEAGMMAEGPIPAWLHFPAGPGVVIGGDSSKATAMLAPGSYEIVCFISSPDGQMHVMKGMHRRLVVAAPPAGAAARAEPTADVIVTLADYTFTLSTPLTAGTHTIRVENAGPQLHEILLIRLSPGKKVADFLLWEQTGMKGEPPARPVGGFVGPDVGGHGFFTVTLTPGAYALVCFVPDATDGKPHVAHGMVREVTVS